jgi:spermidine synthase
MNNTFLEKNRFCRSEGKLYFIDRYDPASLHLHEVVKIFFDFKSDYQHIQIFETKKYGRALALDGFPQISERDGHIYTEALAGPAILSHHDPQRVLILGGGDGAALALILKDRRVKEAILVDIDDMVVRATQSYLARLWENTQYDSRAKIITGQDALLFLKGNTRPFDIIISDLTDPGESAIATHLLSAEYFSQIRRNLNEDGIFVMQAGELTNFVQEGHKRARNLVKSEFSYVLSCGTHIPWFSTVWSFLIARDKTVLPDFTDQSEVSLLFSAHPELGKIFRFLDPKTIMSLFTIKFQLISR